MPWFVYILRCGDGSYYVGFSDDPAERVKRHGKRRGALHTAKHLPVTLVYVEPCSDIESARKRERQLKRWTRAKKEALIAGDVALLKRL